MKTILSLLLASVLALGAFSAYSQEPEAQWGEPIMLFNGKDFSGWKFVLKDSSLSPEKVWSVTEGVIHCTGQGPGYLLTEQPYGNYKLSFQWRWTQQPGNSGLLLHVSGPETVWPKCIEAQLQSGNAGDFYMINGTKIENAVILNADRGLSHRAKHHPSTEKPAGEWNTMEVDCQGPVIRVKVNGMHQNEAMQASETSGRIGLQSEGAPIEFRRVVLTPLADTQSQ